MDYIDPPMREVNILFEGTVKCSHTLIWVRAGGGGAVFGKFQGGVPNF